MFRRLKLRLILINASVIAIITIFFMTGIYALMIRSMHQSSDQLMRLIAADAGSNPGTYITPPELEGQRFHKVQRQRLNYFYVKLNNSGEILETAPNTPIPREQLAALIEESLSEADQIGIIGRQPHEHYRFLKAPLKNGQGMTIVFLNTDYDEKIIARLLGAFTVTGLGGAGLALLGSLFMANRALIPIKKSWEKQKSFVADASHELRTPITVIQTNLDIVRHNPDETVESQMVWLENIQAENKLMAKLVDDLLILARADSNQLQINMEQFDLNQAVREALAPFHPLAGQKGITLTYTCQKELPFFGDHMRIRQLAAILIDNAIKYTPPGGEVNLDLRDNGHTIQMSVRDSGEGIEKEYLDKIFQRFYRVDKARSRESGGTGLGLAIADWIVKEHRGNIKVESVPGAGTVFTVALPRSKPEKAKA